VPDHLKQNFARYVATEVGQDPGQGNGFVDLSGGGALVQQVWRDMDADTLADRGVIVAGDPDSCIRAARLHEETGVDQLMFFIATETIGHEQAMKSIEMFGKHVFPEFRKKGRARKRG
jgi:hypothetical protein